LAAAADTAAWARAANEVAASILSEQVHKAGQVFVDPTIVVGAMHDRIPAAKVEMSSWGEHAPAAIGCICRHNAIITVGANQQAAMTGTKPGLIFDSARATLERYLARRN